MFGNNFGGKARTEDGWLYKNPLFKFIFFVSSSTLKLQEVIQALNKYEKKHLPNVIFLLDRGIIANVISTSDSIEPITIVDNYPEFIPEEQSSSWQLTEFENIGAATLAYLASALNFPFEQMHCFSSRSSKISRAFIQNKKIILIDTDKLCPAHIAEKGIILIYASSTSSLTHTLIHYPINFL